MGGLFVVIALAEFGVIVWLLLRRRDDRQKIIDLELRARRAELRAVPDTIHPRPIQSKGAK
jgi:hypothetical protein